MDFLALHWKQQTDPFALLYSVINTWRLGVPIAYNFLQIFNIQSCAFLKVMGPVQQVPFVGKDLNDIIFPLSLAAISLFTLIDVYSCFLKCFRLKLIYNPKSYETQEKIKEGQFLTEKHRKDKHLMVDYNLVGSKDSDSKWNIDSTRLNSTSDGIENGFQG